MSSTTLTCREVIDLLAEYLEETLSPEMVGYLERHLDACAACVAYLNTYRKTRELTSEIGRVSIPEDFKVRLRQFLLEQLERDKS